VSQQGGRRAAKGVVIEVAEEVEAVVVGGENI
jgi:hypothetical protein